MALRVTRLPAQEKLPKGEPEAECDECGRRWIEVISNPNDGPDLRRYHRFIGNIGRSYVNTTLCSECVEEFGGLGLVDEDYWTVNREDE